MSHSPVVYCFAGMGYIFNLTLASLTLNVEVNKIGNYRYLLLILSIFDMVYTTAQLLIIPIPFLHGYSWCFVQTGLFIKNPAVFQLCTILYCSLFNQSLVLLTYHFVYRYVAICKGTLLYHFTRPSVIAILFLIYVFSATAWALVLQYTLNGPPVNYIQKEFRKTFGYRPSNTQLVGGAYFIEHGKGDLRFVWKSWLGVSLLIVMLMATFLVVIYCANQAKVTLNKGMISSKAHQLQVQLYKTLTIQMCVPLVFEYIPCVSILLSSTVGWTPNLDWTMPFFSAYPVLEPLVVIYFVRDYRNAVLRMVCFKSIASRLRSAEPTVKTVISAQKVY